jgi:16S rRNA processing protein RimM
LELALLGYFVKTHGLKGELVLRADTKFKKKGLKALFVDLNGSKAPYFISGLREVDKGFIVSLEDIDDVKKAAKFAGKSVYLDGSFLVKEKKADDLTGYELIEAMAGSLGRILEADESGPQLRVIVSVNGTEVMLPLADELVTKIDRKQRKIYYTAPPGLLEIYLSGD